MDDRPKDSDFNDLGWGWTRANIIACTALALLVLALVLWQWHGRGHYIGVDIPVEQELIEQATAAINPNTATVAELMSMPSVGPGLAEKIVNYREEYLTTHGPQALAFTSLSDLQNVKGIGPKIAEKLTPYLKFDKRGPE